MSVSTETECEQMEITSPTNRFYAYSIIPALKVFKNITFSEKSYLIVGDNQQEVVTYMEAWDGVSQNAEFGAAWVNGYYRVHIVFIGKADGKTVRMNLEKKPLYWRKH